MLAHGSVNPIILPMKRVCSVAIVLSLVALGFVPVNGCGKKKTVAVQSGKINSAESTSFTEVTSKLDPGGSLYVYLGTEQWLNNLSGKIGKWHEMASSIPDFKEHRTDIDNAFNIGGRLIKDSGLEDVSGIGVSSIAREQGFYFNKLVVHHYAGQGKGFMWTIFGKEPHELSGLDLLPADTAMAAFYDLDASEVWAVVQKECEQSGFPQAADFLKTFPQEFEKGSGMKWDDLIGSFGGEFGIVMTLNSTNTVKVPLPTQEGLEIPEPGIMLIAKVKNDAIFNRMDEALKKSGQRRMIRVDKDGLKMRTIPIPVPLPITLRPSIATSGGYLFLATSDALIKEALAVKGGKAGLKSTDEFKRLSMDVPQQGNQFCFLSQRFSQTMMKIQRQTLAMNQQATPELKELLQSFMQPEKAGFVYAVGANTDEGWITVANGSQGGGNLLAASAVVPALVAAVALPNFAKARETAQRNTCINNLRMIQGAKQQWALERNKTSSDVPGWDDIRPYMGAGKTTLRCPKGGEYNLGAVGEMPSCSIPGHVLPQD
jgi:hypothetical protein